jgi:hypothetical protein
MRVRRATLLTLPLVLILSAPAFAEPAGQPAPPPPQQLKEAIFGAPAANESTASFSWWQGVCSHTCDPCWTSEDCPTMDGGWRQSCVWACY